MLRICAAFVLILLALPAAPAQAGPQGVVRVVDGDTFVIGGQKVRLQAIDAPEAAQACTEKSGQKRVWACGAWVTAQARALFQGQQARCIAQGHDRYGRVVARCSVAGQDMGATLVGAGLAFAYRRYGLQYVQAEQGAACAGRGLHAHQLMAPEAFRAQTRAQTRAQAVAAPNATGDCVIKGNISAKGTRIFHSPGQADYARTVITPEKGERWFCTIAEARAAGWRAARR